MVKQQVIMEKALELFAKQGFEATSVQQITERCGISKGAFYLTFKSKDELILALIDRFMTQVTTRIDHSVKHTQNMENILYTFFHTSFETFEEHSDFAKIFIKEHSHTLNQALLEKMHVYNQQIEKTILAIVEKRYGNEVEHTKYDLVHTIKGLMNAYAELLLFRQFPLDLDLLSKSLAEKTNLLAEHATIPFITRELNQAMKQPFHKDEVSTEQIIEMIEQNLAGMEESIEKESLVLLKHELLNPSLRPALVTGLIQNIRHHPQCKWIAHLLSKHLNIDL